MNKKDYVETYYAKNKEILKAYSRNYKKTHNREVSEYNKKYLKKYRELNAEKKRNDSRAYYLKNKEKIKSKSRIYYQKHIEEVRRYRKTHRKEKKVYDKRYREKYRVILKKRDAEKRERNKRYIKKYRLSHKKEKRDRDRIYYAKKMKHDLLYRISRNLRGSCLKYLKRNNFKKDSNTFKMIGISRIELKNHLEKRFSKGMSWDNYGGDDGWQIDHIIPLSSAKNKEDLIRLFHYTNLQPLWKEDNLKKGSKILYNLS